MILHLFALIGLLTTGILVVSYLVDLWHRAARRYHRPRLETRGERVQMVDAQGLRALGRKRKLIRKVESTDDWVQVGNDMRKAIDGTQPS